MMALDVCGEPTAWPHRSCGLAPGHPGDHRPADLRAADHHRSTGAGGFHITGVRVSITKKLNDGNYGSEEASVSLDAHLDVGEDGEIDDERADAEATALRLQTLARNLATAQLALSPSLAVRRALERQDPLPLPGEDEL